MSLNKNDTDGGGMCCRYRNIWSFEHTCVRMRKTKPDDDDYMNASYQPLGTTKRYIAMQGPLLATFTDFWTYVPCFLDIIHRTSY